MNFQKTLSYFVLFFLSLNAHTQNIFIEINTGISQSKTSIKWIGETQNDYSNSYKFDQLYSLGVSAKIHKFVYLKSELGLTSTQNFLDFKYRINEKPNLDYILGWYNAEHIYIAILPELRFLSQKDLYFNSGIGLFHTVSSTLSGISSNYVNAYNLNANRLAFISNAGFNLHLNRLLSFNIGFGFNYLANKSKNARYYPEIGYIIWYARVGMNYVLR